MPWMESYTRARAEGLGFECRIGIFGRVERYLLIMPLLALNMPIVVVSILAIVTPITALQRIIHVWKQAQARLS